ncbi:uncharacterized protein K452DRAFT_160893 [Aplosporella prunicola CBS 121167]|uniref:N-acetyltransferase domain-containing protein n=1 Tax=Aplosporella prunicola CBS 121167 TaxID=1176127 RepID=A0A6A6BLE2_9PEZI|nr:uncharacterized protein K452DRAFT_160893 [Aplosporella prunicola CBS 121167]KAF2143677.1 hypothetical protein K452DRAFT_160893 [Aplosporella prunicola CBS 121167]
MAKTTLAPSATAVRVFDEPKAALSMPIRKDSATDELIETLSKAVDSTIAADNNANAPVTATPNASVDAAAANTPVVGHGTQVHDQVRIVPTSEYKAAAFALAEAFADDDVSRYFVDTPDRAHWSAEQKWDLHLAIMEYMTYAHCLKGLVTTIGPDYDGVALWMPPGNNVDDLLTVLRSGMWRLRYRLSAEGKKRFFDEFLPLLHDTKAAVLGARDAASWYLVYIGTRPGARGKGYCRRLIEHITRVADAERRATYLESSNERNVQIYRRLGFAEEKRMYLQRERRVVALDVMVREPEVRE